MSTFMQNVVPSLSRAVGTEASNGEHGHTLIHSDTNDKTIHFYYIYRFSQFIRSKPYQYKSKILAK